MAEPVLVTGAHGFLGRHVARAMARRGFTVTGIGHGDWTGGGWRAFGLAEWHDADVTLDTLMRHGGDPVMILHCAGGGSVGYSMDHPFQDFERTVGATLAVLEFVRLRGARARIALPSSAAVYGAARAMPIRIGDPLAPVSAYGTHKKMAEDLCRSYATHFGVRSAIVRLFSVQGRGLRKQLLWDACQKLSKGETLFAGTGEETRDWLHVEDAADLLCLAAARAEPSAPVVNGGSGRGVAVRDALTAIAARLGLAEGPRFSGAARAGDPVRFTADISEAKAWGWTPTHDLGADIGDYVNWFKEGAP